jgi:penicillin-binding protein-related factor A (putative recombinase)
MNTQDENISDEEFNAHKGKVLEAMEKDYLMAKEKLKDIVKPMLDSSNISIKRNKELIQEMYERHKEDGNFFPVYMGMFFSSMYFTAITTKMMTFQVLDIPNMLQINLAVPMIRGWVEEFQRGDMEKELSEIAKG